MASVAEQIVLLDGACKSLVQNWKDLQTSLSDHLNEGLYTVSRQLNGAIVQNHGVPLSRDPSVLVAELQSLQSCYLQSSTLQELQSGIRSLDKQLRNVENGIAGEDFGTFLEAVLAAVRSLSVAQTVGERFQQLSRVCGVHILELVTTGEVLTSRIRQAQAILRNAVDQELNRRLVKAGWPPSLSQLSAGSSSSTSDEDLSVDPGHLACWSGFGENLNAIQQLATSLLLLQQAVDGVTTHMDGGEDGPLLWLAEALAGPVGDRLRLHFASGLPTDQADKPEWLLGTALKVVRGLGPLLGPLQGVLAARQLDKCYNMQFEFARAVRQQVKAILRSHTLPALEAQLRSAPWTHVMDECMAFERQLAPLRGFLGSEQQLPGSCCRDGLPGLLLEAPGWCEPWLQAELDAAKDEVAAELDSEVGWRALESCWGDDADEDVWGPSTSGTDRSAAWHHEFFPPMAAEALMSVVGALLRRAQWLPPARPRRKFVKCVVRELIRWFRSRLQRECLVAEQYRDLSSPQRAPRVCAAINAAHFLEHSLREPQLLAQLDGGPSSAPSDALLLSSPASSATASNAAGCLEALLEREASAFATFRREWTLKLAKSVASTFVDASKAYRRQLDVFAEQAGPAEVDPTSHPFPLPPISPLLLPALEGLQLALDRWSQWLDSVCFSDLWRALAVAANRLMYNDVATEARFSHQGGLQLQADVAGMVAVFGPYPPRPAAHFKESLEACRLLTLDPAELDALLPSLTAGTDVSRAALAQHGIVRLTAEQASAVLRQRL